MKSDIEGPLSATEKSSSVSEYGRSATPIRKWVLHVADWIAVVVVVAVSQIILIPQPYSVSFIVTNPYIQQFHFQDSFDITRACVVLSTAVPVVIIIIWLGYFRRSLGDIHMAVLGLGMALSFCALFVSVFKQMALSLSPDFLGRCELDQADYDRSFNTGARLSK
ncbi:hypothetical protein GGH19_003680 [Coemansia sp. RSA 1807]|nr:hypothetical protein GGH19_003680 [Coemansia sp. RSA 1807]